MKTPINLKAGDEVQIIRTMEWTRAGGARLSTGDVGRVEKTYGPTDRADGRAVVYFPVWGPINVYAGDEGSFWKKVDA